MFGLGVLYYNGSGVPVNFQKAREYYKKAAELGDSKGIYFFYLKYFFNLLSIF